MKYVALLRGINVGGNSKIEMARLRQTFERIGCANVSTYINSGNVLFTDPRLTSDLVPAIESAILSDFGLSIRIVIRDATNILRLCADIPADWTNDTIQRTDVMFLWDEYDSPHVIENIDHNPEIENIRYIDGALVWNCPREFVMKGGGVKLIKSDLYKHMTIRNINTVRKLGELLEKLPDG